MPTELKEDLMTAPQQPGVDPQGEAEVIEDLQVPADTQEQVAGGGSDYYLYFPNVS
jgi:hypothetical protein